MMLVFDFWTSFGGKMGVVGCHHARSKPDQKFGHWVEFLGHPLSDNAWLMFVPRASSSRSSRVWVVRRPTRPAAISKSCFQNFRPEPLPPPICPCFARDRPLIIFIALTTYEQWQLDNDYELSILLKHSKIEFSVGKRERICGQN